MARRNLLALVAALAVCGVELAPGQGCIQNPGFDSPDGWSLNQGGTSGTARILGGFLELSVSFPGDFAQARQRCSSAAFQRTVEVDVSDFGIGTVNFRLGWQSEDGLSGDYVIATHAGTASATTTNPAHQWVVFRADRDAIGLSAQALDNVQIMVTDLASPEAIANHLLGLEEEPPFADANGDHKVGIEDVVTRVNELHPVP